MFNRWTNIKGHDDYSIDEFGEVKSSKGKKEIILKAKINKDGYKIVTLCNNGIKHFISVHRLVALTFIPNPNGFPQVNHIDGDTLNNHKSNLEWNTSKQDGENRIKRNATAKGEGHGRAKLTEKQVLEIRQLKNKFSYREIGEMFGVTRYTIYLIYKNQNWKNDKHKKITLQ
jgi:hypothetical protein